MNPRVVLAIVRKDLAEVGANRFVWLPTLVLPLVFTVLMPIMIVSGPSFFRSLDARLEPPPPPLTEPHKDWRPQGEGKERAVRRAGRRANPLEGLIPADLLPLMRNQPPERAAAILLLGHFFAPVFLLIPLTLASLLGANAFAGEKERKTLEALLYSPASDAELFMGKTIAAFLPALLLTWASYVLYGFVVNGLTATPQSGWWFPSSAWWPLMLWVTPAVAGLGVCASVIVSAFSPTFLEANQRASMLTLLIIGLMVAHTTGVLLVTPMVAIAMGAVIWLIDAALLYAATVLFSRSRQISRV